MKTYILLLLFSFFTIMSAHAKDIFVATTGDNTTGTGTIDSPYQTIQKASNMAVSGDIIQVRAGIYREMVDIKANGVTFQPYNGEAVTINGTDLLTSWALTSGTTYQTTMSWNVDAKWGSNQLFSDGTMIELARWPDQTSADIVKPTLAIADAVTASGTQCTITDASFNEPDGRWVGAKIWINLSNMENDGQGWTGTVISTNAGAHTITLDFRGDVRLGLKPWGMNNKTEFFLFNPTAAGVTATGGVDALLSNGEWWKNGNTLYVKTPNGDVPNASESGTNVIEAKRRHFAFFPSVTKYGYTIKGFNLFGCAITTDNNPWVNREIILEAAHDIIIDGITAKYVSHQTIMEGNWQDEFWYGAGIVIRGRNNIIRNCTIQYSATAAIHVSGFGNKVLNNIISNTNYMCANSGAVNTGFICQDVEITNNTINNTTIMAINFGKVINSNINTPDQARIHHNTIYNFMLRSGDSGAIDGVGYNRQYFRVDHNLIYNTVPTSGSSMVHGIYFDYGGDDQISNSTIDHNIITDVPVPILINSVRFMNVFNNVALSNNGGFSIVNGNGDTKGVDVKIYNNILSNRPNNNPTDGWSTYNLSLADIQNNIINATGTVLTDLFVNPIGRDYHLKPTATNAIDRGLSVGIYDENVIALPDLGAFEQGTIFDNTAPSIPLGVNANTISNNGFTLNWKVSTDNIQVTGYNIYINDALYDSTTNKTSKIITGLSPSTTYTVTVKARDYYNNISGASTGISVSTLAYPGRTIHLEAENNNFKSNGSIASGAWVSYNTNSYLQFNSVSLSNQNFFTANISATAGAILEVRLNSSTGPLLGTLTVSSTGNLTTFQQQTGTLSSVPTGVYDLFIVAKNTIANTCKLDWVELSGGDVIGQIPSIPHNLSINFVGSTQLGLKWNASIDDVAVTGYEVFKNNVSIGTTTINYMVLDGLTTSTDYSFAVRARDAAGNWSAQSTVLNTATNGPKLTGAIIGTPGIWSTSNDHPKAFDGNINTYFASTTSDYAWVGLDLGTPKVITSILFYPLSGWSSAMTLGIFQGSNTADFSTGVVTFYTINVRPAEASWSGFFVNNSTAFRYVRYKAPAASYCKIAEAEFYGTGSTGISNLQSATEVQIFPNPATDQITIRNLGKNSLITISSIEGKDVFKKNVSIYGHLTINVSGWSRGIYIVKINNVEIQQSTKVVVR